MKRVFPLSFALATTIVAAAFSCLGSDQIRVYTIPKEIASSSPPSSVAAPEMSASDSMSSGQVPLGDASGADIRWATPSNWKELPRTGVRIGNFLVPGPNGTKAEVAITSFPGTVGTELENVNRWRRELNLPATSESSITSAPISVGGAEGKLYDLTGETESTVVADVMRNGASWFLKLKGEKAVVASARPTFLEFLKSIQFTGGASPAAAISAADPHAGLNISMPASVNTSDADASGNAKWNPPANWTQQAPGPMILKSFSVDDGNGPAMITISSFPGDVGGVVANVNRWRGQLSLPPLADDNLSSTIQSLDAGDNKASMVDFTGTSAKTGQPARMLAVIVPHGGQTWFYKIVGDGATISKEKDNFVRFVQTAQYQ